MEGRVEGAPLLPARAAGRRRAASGDRVEPSSSSSGRSDPWLHLGQTKER